MIADANQQLQRVKLHQLRYFVAVAEELHFRRAAARLSMTQPPLSEAIRELESAVGSRLLERSRRGVTLTPAGDALLRDARGILRDVARAVDVARRIGMGQTGRLKIGFVGSAVYGVLPDLIRGFKTERPDVELRLQERSTVDQLASLRSGDLDVGFVRPPVADAGLAVHTIVREANVAALPDGHALSRLRRIPRHRLAGERFVLFPRDQAPGLHDAITSFIGAGGRPLDVVQEVPEMQTIIGLVASGLGVSLVPESVQALARTGVIYRPVAGAPRSDLAMVTRAADPSPLVSDFARMAREKRR